MPNVWTHLLFGEEVLKRTGASNWMAVRGLANVFRFGCQGPDPLFYYNFLPWGRNKLPAKLGSIMHEEHCGLFLMDLLRELAGAGKERDDPALAYGCGFLLHHILDRHAHPYIFVKSGFRKWDHQRFEVILDTRVAARLRGIRTWATPVWREIEIPGGLSNEVASLLQKLALRHYPEAAAEMTEADWRKAYGDMIAAQKLFHDPWGVKRALTFGKIEPLVYKRKNAPLDYENEAGAPWIDPVDGTTEYRETFGQLWERALADGERTLRQALRYLDAASQAFRPMAMAGDRHAPKQVPVEVQTLEQELARMIGNVSYSTGRPCGSGEIRHVMPIWLQ